MTTALLRVLRAARPAARIAVLTSEECLPLLDENPDLDEVLGIPMTASGPSLRPVALWRLRRQLRAWTEGTAVILHRHPSLALLCRMMGFRRVLGFAHEKNPWLTDAVPFDLNCHRMERQEQLLHRLGVTAPARQLRLVLRSRERGFGETVWSQAPGGMRLVLAPGGGKNRWSEMPNRRWPAAYFHNIALRAVAAGMAVQFIGGPDDRETICLAAEGSGAATAGAGVWALRQTAAVIAAAHLVVSNDSLPLFLAAALQTPVIGLYGPTDSRLIHPPGCGAALQGAVGCGPCFSPLDGVLGQAYRCPRPRCLEALTPDAVWNEVLRHAPRPVSVKLA